MSDLWIGVFLVESGFIGFVIVMFNEWLFVELLVEVEVFDEFLCVEFDLGGFFEL